MKYWSNGQVYRRIASDGDGPAIFVGARRFPWVPLSTTTRSFSVHPRKEPRDAESRENYGRSLESTKT